MFRDILVPLDGSQFAEAALPLGARLARLAQAGLHLLLVHEPMGARSGMGDMVVPPPGLDAERKERERPYLAGTASALRQPDGMPVGFHETSGSAGPEICEEATPVDADPGGVAPPRRGGVPRHWAGGVVATA